MSIARLVASGCLSLSVSLFASSLAWAETDAAGFEHLGPDQIAWKNIPNERGVQYAVVSGDRASRASCRSREVSAAHHELASFPR